MYMLSTIITIIILILVLRFLVNDMAIRLYCLLNNCDYKELKKEEKRKNAIRKI